MRPLFSYIFLWMSGHVLAQADSIPLYSAMEDSVPYKVTRLAINSQQADYSPFMLNNALFFVSSRPSHGGVTYSSANSSEGLTDVFRAERKDSVRFSNVSAFQAINTPYNEGPFSLSKDGRLIYYTGNEKQSAGKGKTKTLLKIFYSTYDGKAWSAPAKPAFCKEDYSYGHPAISSDKQCLVFCSELPGGYGGMDLYACYLKEGTWSAPVNLGPKINSPSHEVFPFISDRGMLYFSSARPGGSGGLDIYATQFNDTFEEMVWALPAPINSASDDFGVWTDSLNTSGYFSSNRSGNDDLYYFGSIQPDFSKASVTTMKTKFCYTFFEETALETQDSLSFSFEWDLGDGTRSRELRTKHCYTKPGSYTVSLNAVEKTTGEVFANQLTYELIVKPPAGLYINCADSVAASCELFFNTERCDVKGYELKQVYWDFGDGKYSYGHYVKHHYAKSGLYWVRLGVVARNTETKKEALYKTTRLITIIEH
jgi:hypothetical protein